MSYILQPATLQDGLILNARLNEADRQELLAGGHEPLEDIFWGLKHSLRPLSIFDKESRLAAIAGVVPVRLGEAGIQDRGYLMGSPWMLTTDSAGTEPVAFVKQAQAWVDGQLTHFRLLRNKVWRGNSSHIKLLRLLGFSVQDASSTTEQFLDFFQCAPR